MDMLSVVARKLKHHLDKAFLYNTGALVFSNFYAQAVAVVSGILIARWVPPAEYGIWVALNLLPAYFGWMQMGTANGLGRQLPLKLGERHHEEAAELVRTSLTFSCAAALLAPLVLFAVAMGIGNADDARWKYGALATAGYLLLNTIGSVLFMVARSYRRFPTIALIVSAQTTVSLLGLLLVWRFGLYGLYLRLLAAQFCLTLGYVIVFRRYLAFGFSRASLVQLVRVGAPIFLAGCAGQLFSVADRSAIALFLSPADLGIYGFAVFVYTGVVTIGNSMCDVLFPQMVFEYARGGGASSLRRYAVRHVVTVALAAVPLCVLWTLLPWLVGVLAPRYQAAAQPARILLVSGVLWGAGGVFGNVLLTVGRAWLYAATLGVSAALLWGITSLFLKLGYNLTGAAWANLCAVSIFVLVTLGLALTATRSRETRPECAILPVSLGSAN